MQFIMTYWWAWLIIFLAAIGGLAYLMLTDRVDRHEKTLFALVIIGGGASLPLMIVGIALIARHAR